MQVFKAEACGKSSTEEELIGLSDGLMQVVWTRNFVEDKGYKVEPVKVLQDNKSTILLAYREGKVYQCQNRYQIFLCEGLNFQRRDRDRDI